MTEGLKGIIPRTRELGRLRTGDSVPVVDRQTRKPVLNDDGSPKMRPARRHTWRITSASQTLLETAAELYGGTVTEWTDAPTPGQWELATERDSIEVLIPYDDSSLSQAFELWRAGGCERRCNGEVMDGGERCVCPADIEARMAGAALRTPTACKPTTRLNVLLPDIGELGFFRLEAHGYHAASEIPGQLALQQGIKVKLGDPNPWFTAWLRIDPRSGKKDGKTTQYTVPVVELPIKARSLMVDPVLQDPAAALSPGTSQAEGGSTPALGAGVAQDGIPHTPPAPPPNDDRHSEAAARGRHPTALASEDCVPRAWQNQFLRGAKGLPPDLLDEVVLTATGGRTANVAQILKTETGDADRALEQALKAPAEPESATA